MNKRLIFGSLLLIVLLSGCTNAKQSYGTTVSNFEQKSVKDLFSGGVSPSQTVMVEGKITTECPVGCWFYLDDGTGSVYVKLPDFILPQITGARVRVYGTFYNNTLVGKRVETA